MYLFTYLQIPQVKKIVLLMNVLKLLNPQDTVEETAASFLSISTYHISRNFTARLTRKNQRW